MDPSEFKRRLTCILAADAVGYSRHMGQDEEGTIQVLAAHRAVIDGIIAFHRGRIVGTAGDSVLAEFSSAVEAVRCAVEIQDALKTRNDSLPEHRQLLFRVGVNLGDVVVQDADILGDGVNVAARLESMAEPGGICIASSVYDQITGKLDLGFDDIGEQHLKNISRPVRVYRVSGTKPVEHIPLVAAPVPKPPRAAPPVVWAVAGALLTALAGAGIAWQSGWLGGRATPGAQPGAPAVADAAPPAAPKPAPSVAVIAPPAATAPKTAVVAQKTAPAVAPAQHAARPSPVAPTLSNVQPQVPASAPARPADPSPPAPEPAPVAQTAPGAAVGAGPFDGTWNVKVDCPKHEDGALGYTVDLVASVRNGFLHGQVGTEGRPGWLLMRGEVRPDGKAHLLVTGLTGDPKLNVYGARRGSPYFYDVSASFDGRQGTGRRLQLRACVLSFAKQ